MTRSQSAELRSQQQQQGQEKGLQGESEKEEVTEDVEVMTTSDPSGQTIQI